MKTKEFVCSNGSVNCYGFRVETSGINLKNFKKNPVGFFNHNRGNDWLIKDSSYTGPIIRWTETRIENDELISTPVFDENDALGKAVGLKVETDFIRAASIGFRIIETSNDPKLMVQGQTGPTVTKCELIEISVVDIGANKQALALYDADGKQIELNETTINTTLAAGLKHENNIPKNNTMKLKIMAAWTALSAFLNLEKGKDHEVELSAEQLTDINAKLDKLTDVEAQVVSLTQEKTTLTGKVSDLEGKLSAAETKATGLQTKLDESEAEVVKLRKPAEPIIHPVSKLGDPQPNSELSELEKETMTEADVEARNNALKYGNPAAEKAKATT